MMPMFDDLLSPKLFAKNWENAKEFPTKTKGQMKFDSSDSFIDGRIWAKSPKSGTATTDSVCKAIGIGLPPSLFKADFLILLPFIVTKFALFSEKE